MDKQLLPYIFSFYDTQVTEMICKKYNIEQTVALKKFLFSETYKMLSDVELQMWDFSPIGIFDMWETEQKTGNPRDSLYISRD